MPSIFCAIDVGTRAARAGFFTGQGEMLSRAAEPIALHMPDAGRAEHDSQEIWTAVCRAVAAARKAAGVAPEDVGAIAFDATCSLVLMSDNGKRPALSPSESGTVWDTISWMDHRAEREARVCTATGHRVLEYAGGVMSPEMQIPKLMWVKRNRPEIWASMSAAMDLTDYLAWRACGSGERSRCTLTGKWTFLDHDGGWQQDFFDRVGLEDIVQHGALPSDAVAPGNCLGTLSARAAADLGLTRGCRVAAGLIDAFAGGLGVIGQNAESEGDRHLALIAGTSTCVMGISPTECRVSGAWGPYRGAILPGRWAIEAGQSATGALLDYLIRSFSDGLDPTETTHDRIAARIERLQAEEGEDLARDLHVLPDLHGKRSPHADPTARGVFSGMTLDRSFDGLCRIYWRTAVSLGLGLRQVVDHFNDHGFRIDTLHLTGGHARNPLLRRIYADATGCTIRVNQTGDAVLLGTAMVARAGYSGGADCLADTARDMAQPYREISPRAERRAAMDRDYRIFQRLAEHRRELAALSQQTQS